MVGTVPYRHRSLSASFPIGIVPLVNNGDPLPFVSTDDCIFVATQDDTCFRGGTVKLRCREEVNGKTS